MPSPSSLVPSVPLIAKGTSTASIARDTSEYESYRYLFNAVFTTSSSTLQCRLLIYDKCEGRKVRVKFPIMNGHVMCQTFGTRDNEFLDTINTHFPHQFLK